MIHGESVHREHRGVIGFVLLQVVRTVPQCTAGLGEPISAARSMTDSESGDIWKPDIGDESGGSLDDLRL